MVEHFLGKEEVIGSIPIVGSSFFWSVAWVLILGILNVFRWVYGRQTQSLIGNYESNYSVSVFRL